MGSEVLIHMLGVGSISETDLPVVFNAIASCSSRGLGKNPCCFEKLGKNDI